MARITDEKTLLARVVKMLPKGIPASAIESVECDLYDGLSGGGSYWVYLANGYICPCMGCHTIHEDTLAELKPMVKSIEIWKDDPALTDPTQGYGDTEATEAVRELTEGQRMAWANITASAACRR